MKRKMVHKTGIILITVCLLLMVPLAVLAKDSSIDIQNTGDTGILEVKNIWVAYDDVDRSYKIYASGVSKDKETEISMCLYNAQSTLTTDTKMTEDGSFKLGCLPAMGNNFSDGLYSVVFYDTTKEYITMDNVREKGYHVDVKINNNTVQPAWNEEKPTSPEPKGDEVTSGVAITVTDIRGHWAEKNIRTLLEKGIVTGYKDGTFRPDSGVTRAEFAQIVKSAFAIVKTKEMTEFDDVKPADWHYEAVATLYEHGVVSGSEPGRFSPEETITREQMSVILSKIAVSVKMDLVTKRIYIPFIDDANISDYAKEAVKKMYQAGIISGVETAQRGFYRFQPQAGATRAEVAAIVCGLLSQGN